MSRVSTYLNFQGNTEEAFAFYASIFGGAVRGPQRFGDTPMGSQLTPEDANKVLHIELDILGGHVIMATDMLESNGQHVRVGNNTTINLEPDTLDEATRIFDALCQGGSDTAPLMQMPWGAWWGCVLDRFDIRWMINVAI
jgi:PhnB protein